MKAIRYLLTGAAALCGYASAQPLDQLACAAGVHCSGALPPDEVRVVLGFDSQYEAERAFIDASRDFPDDLWRCAATGSGCTNMTQNEARVMIPLPEEAFAPAEVVRGRQPPAAPAMAQAPVAKPAATPPAKSRGGIEVEVSKPGPTEIDLRPPVPAPGGEIQPQDGHWTFTHGSRPRASGHCLPGVAEAVSKQMPAPQSGPVTFARPFNASQILRSPQVAWKRMAPNHWRGTLTGAGGSAMRMEWDVRVTSPTRMEGDSIVRVTVPSACTLSTPFTFVRQ
ncbi:MAG: hypothetical protein BGO74_05585 [Burkholderiales bacterium 68-12]|nr:MAG: hypothetical protein BGO74_05585 [Burkholderiales bacterium 68-12]